MADAAQGSAQGSIQAGGSGWFMSTCVQLKARYISLSSERRTWLMAGTAMLLAVAAGLMWYAMRPDWRVLFSGLEGKDVQQVSQELGAAGVPFQVTADGGGIEVPADQLDKARMEVAAKGMPQTGRLGFELFDKPNWVGSEFDEKVNYQRALEGELEHTIGTLGVVRSARVHLVLPRESLFSGEQQAAKASVVVKLKKSTLSAEQIDSVRNLVAGAVESLNPDRVTLVDADGRVNLDGHKGAPGQAEIEQGMEAKLIAMLEPLAGTGNVRATVNVAYEQGSEERTDEIYDPSLSVPVTIQKSEQVSAPGSSVTGRSGGVPGTASNTPAAAPAGAVQGSGQAAAPGAAPLLAQKEKDKLPVYPDASAGGQTIKQESGSYAVSKHIVHTESGAGRMRRVTAAVVVNDRVSYEGTGKTQKAVWKPRSTDEMRRLNELAQAAVGFDMKRGDQVVLENVAFSSNTPEAGAGGFDRVTEEAMSFFRGQGGLKTLMTGALGLLLVWFVLKPVSSQLVATLKETPALGAGTMSALGPMHGLGTGSEAEDQGLPEYTGGHGMQPVVEGGVRRGNELAVPGKPEWRQKQELTDGGAGAAPAKVHIFDQVADHVRREPVESTRLLAAWIGAEGERD